MQIQELGEFGVIELLSRMVVEQRGGPDNATPFSFRLMVDIGDDTAAWQTGEATELFTTDTVVEGVHFTRATTPWRDLGWKCLASNVSDIAAMGGLPLYALITLGLPPDTELDDLKQLYRGMLEISNKYGVAIVGGDMVRSPVVFITVSLTGVHSGRPMLRSNGQPGDQVAVTGLADDLAKLCHSSGLAARLHSDKIPVHPLLRQAFPDGYVELALNGGEDYQLLFTAPAEVMVRVMPQLPEAAAVVGELMAGEPGRVTVVDTSGVERVAARGGWDHFR